MSSEIKVSIILPIYNAEEGVEETIRSIVNQNFQNWELLIQDNFSKDKTFEKASKFIDSRISIHQENDRGIYDAMNKAIQKSNGDYLYFIGAGDKLADPFILGEIFENAELEHPIIYGHIQYENLNSKKVNDIHLSSFDKQISWKNTLHHQGAFYKKELLKGGFNLQYQILADYHKNIELYLKNTKAQKTDLLIAKCDGTGVSKNFKWSLYQEEIKLKKSLYSLPYWLFVQVPWVLGKFLYKRT